jgi:hypothetical protein
MLSNPKSPKHTFAAQHGRSVMCTPTTACIALFIAFNLSWFIFSLMSMGSKQAGPRSVDVQPPAGRAGGYVLPEVGGGPPASSQQAQRPQHAATGRYDPVVHSGGADGFVGVGNPESSLFHPRSVSSGSLSWQDSTVDELVRSTGPLPPNSFTFGRGGRHDAHVHVGVGARW